MADGATGGQGEGVAAASAPPGATSAGRLDAPAAPPPGRSTVISVGLPHPSKKTAATVADSPGKMTTRCKAELQTDRILRDGLADRARAGRRSEALSIGFFMPPIISILLSTLPHLTLATQLPSPAGFECETPDQLEAGQTLQMVCNARPELRAVAVVLFHRAQGHEAFTPEPALRTAKGIFKISLCPSKLSPGTTHFYFEARDAEDQVVASSGDLDRPHLLDVHGRARLAASERPLAPSRASNIHDDDPLADARAEREAERLAEERSMQRPPGRFFLGFGAGFGYGAYPESRLDFRRDLRIQGNTGAAGIVLLTPEAGYQITERIAAGVQLYWQQIGGSGIGDGQTGAPARRSFTALARARYQVGDGRVQWISSAFLGAGNGFHLVVPPLPDQGLRRNDSVRSGPVVLGPGTGVMIHLTPHAVLIAELRLLTGVPRLAALIDSRIGAEVAF
jgi:hypothetical protein